MTKRQTLKLILHKDTIALIASLVFFWFTIGLVADSAIGKKELTPHKGKLVQIDSVIKRVKNKLFFKEVKKELRLTINSEDKYFTSLTTKHFGDITPHIALGDIVTIFTKTRFLGIFGMKKSNDISHLTKGDVIVVDFQKYQRSISGLFILTLLASVGFFILYYVRTRRRYIFKILGNT